MVGAHAHVEVGQVGVADAAALDSTRTSPGCSCGTGISVFVSVPGTVICQVLMVLGIMSFSLFVFPDGLALFHERIQAFHGILGGHQFLQVVVLDVVQAS
jgi:hypothetical protein